MLDLHTHLLPGVDDGPKRPQESLELARVMTDAGTTRVVCTPHCHRHLRLMKRDIAPRVANFQRQLREDGFDLRVYPGSEVQLWSIDWVREKIENDEVCLLGGEQRFMLLEFVWREEAYPEGTQAPDFVRWLAARGTQTIIAHPERHSFLRDEPERLNALAEAGAWFQLTVGSLKGEFGPDANQSARDMMHAGYPLVLASDSHGMYRVSGVEEGIEFAREEAGTIADEIRARLGNVEDYFASLDKD